MIRGIIFVIAGAALSVLAVQPAAAQRPAGGTWLFVVSGDSRNCGDVVMPGIAEISKKNQAAFYWHLGDLRAIYTYDEDILHQPEHKASPLAITVYLNIAWPDFITSQIEPFGSIPFLVGIGNHETFSPMKT